MTKLIIYVIFYNCNKKIIIQYMLFFIINYICSFFKGKEKMIFTFLGELSDTHFI
jgi:hypothetical protein